MGPVETTPRTVGISPKVPVQAITTVIVFLLALLGLDLDPGVSGALGVLIGAGAGYIAPPGDIIR